MKVTVEVSLYPLTENFEQVVIDYIAQVKAIPESEVFVNGLSTQVIGDYYTVLNGLTEINKTTFEKHKCVVIMKMAAGEKTVENLPEVLK